MKKLFLIFLIMDAWGAGCEYWSGWIASDELSFQTDCPSGYVEAPAYIKVADNDTGCPSGYIDVSARYKEVMCDTKRGTCSSSAYVCPAPN